MKSGPPKPSYPKPSQPGGNWQDVPKVGKPAASPTQAGK